LADIRKLAGSFRFTLLNMMHSRIAYPADEDKPSKVETEAKATA
jgi:membrane-associated HD superfamily phosphohydrolase